MGNETNKPFSKGKLPYNSDELKIKIIKLKLFT